MAATVHNTPFAEPSPSRDDDVLLSFAASWRLARTRAQLVWAQRDLDTHFDTKGDLSAGAITCPSDDLNRMAQCLDILQDCEPHTLRGAQEMLRIVLEILAHREVDPEATLSEGPILQMVRQVAEALGYADGDTPLKPKPRCA